QRPNVASFRPSSRATVATVRPVLITSFTASSLYSGVNPRRVRPMMNILSYEVSTQRGQGQSGKQGRFDDAAVVLGDRLEPGSLSRLLADEGHRLFGDDYFADLYAPTHRGRPTIPARVVATVMLLQSHEGLSYV